MESYLSFEDVYERHKLDVYRFCVFQLRNIDEAEDIAGEVFVRAYKAYGHTSLGEDEVRSWLIRIARNAIIDHQRRVTRWRKVLVQFVQGSAESHEDVENIAAVNEDIRIVREALQKLKPRARMLITMRCFAGLTFDEIGRLTGLSAGAAQTATHRAMERLRTMLEGDG